MTDPAITASRTNLVYRVNKWSQPKPTQEDKYNNKRTGWTSSDMLRSLVVTYSRSMSWIKKQTRTRNHRTYNSDQNKDEVKTSAKMLKGWGQNLCSVPCCSIRAVWIPCYINRMARCFTKWPVGSSSSADFTNWRQHHLVHVNGNKQQTRKGRKNQSPIQNYSEKQRQINDPMTPLNTQSRVPWQT